MRFFTVALSALAAFTSVVLALTDSDENPITFPTEGTVLIAGAKTTIHWTPSPGAQGTISLVLRKGADSNLAILGTITSDAPNTGSFEWTPESSLTAGNDYAIQIIAGTLTNYSPKFTIESSNTATTSTSTSTSSRSTTSTTSSTSTSTSTTSTTTDTTSTSTSATTTETTGSAGTSGASNRTMTSSHSTTATRSSESSGATGTGGDAPSLNGASQLSSSFALVFCVLAGMVYLN